MRKYVLAFFGLALLLSACRIESNIIINIEEDGSATVGAEVGFDEEMLDLVSQGGGDPSDILGDLPDLGGTNVEPIERVEGDMTYYGVTTDIENLSTYDFDGFEGEAFSEFSYEFDDKSATLSAKVDATGIGDLGGGDLPIDPAEITGDIFSARVLVTMPGTVDQHNADEVMGDGTLVWNLPLAGSKDIFATSSFDTSGFNWIWFLVGGILLVGVLAAVAAVMTSRKDSEKAVSDAAAEYQETADSQQATAEEAAELAVEPEDDGAPSEEASLADETMEVEGLTGDEETSAVEGEVPLDDTASPDDES
jgi:hypothetical protein